MGELPQGVALYNLTNEIADDLESIANSLVRLMELAEADGNHDLYRSAERMHREVLMRVETLRDLIPPQLP